MTRPLSDIDLQFLEDVTAVAVGGNDLCHLLAVCQDPLEQLTILRDIQLKFHRIRELAIEHKPHVTAARMQRLGIGPVARKN